MPYINIRITDENVTDAQRAALIRGSTDLMVSVLGKNPATTHVTIDEIPLANWGVGGLPVTEFRRANAEES